MTSFYQRIILILDEEVANGYLSETNRNTILSLLSKSMIRVFYKDETLLKEVIEMTEPILELEFEKIEKKYRAIEQQYQQMIAEKDKALSQKDAEIADLQRRLADLQSN